MAKLKAQMEIMERELKRWRAGESVDSEEQVQIVEMDASTTSALCKIVA